MSGASVATTAMIEPAPAGGCPRGSSGAGTTVSFRTWPTGAPFTTNPSREPWLACTSSPTVKLSPPAVTTRDAVPVPPLKSWQTMPVPPPHVALGHRPAARPGQRRGDVLGPHVAAVHVVQPAVVGLAHHRHAPEERAGGAGVDLAGHEGVVHDAHRVAVGQRDRRGSRRPDSRIHSSPVSTPLPFRR